MTRSFSIEDLERADWKLDISYLPFMRERYGTPLAIQTVGIDRRTHCAKCGAFDEWKEKRVFGKGRNRVVLDEPVMICRVCGTLQDTKEAVRHHSPAMMRSGWDGGARVRGRTMVREGVPRQVREQRVYVNETRIVRGSTEDRLIGGGNVGAHFALIRIRNALQTAERTYWPARCYTALVMKAGTVAGVLRIARDKWDEYPFTWSYREVQQLVEEGRSTWCGRLVREDLLWGEGTCRRNEPSAPATQPAR